MEALAATVLEVSGGACTSPGDPCLSMSETGGNMTLTPLGTQLIINSWTISINNMSCFFSCVGFFLCINGDILSCALCLKKKFLGPGHCKSCSLLSSFFKFRSTQRGMEKEVTDQM